MSLLSITDLEVHLPTGAGLVHAVNGLSFDIAGGETVGLIGESGCGKSTLGRALLRLSSATGGRIELDGQDITHLDAKALKPVRPKIQMIFQDNAGALNPRHTVGQSIGQPLRLAGWSAKDARARVYELLAQVGLPKDAYDRYPNAFSGGQRQRIGIARAIALNPKLIVCDEPVSALDPSVRAQIINLLKDLQQRLGISYLFISHDLAVVEHIADRVIVMYLGQVMEQGPRGAFWKQPLHPYTRALLAAVPSADPDAVRTRTVLQGELPSNLSLPAGCPFQARCPLATDLCRTEKPALRRAVSGNDVACHLVEPAPLLQSKSIEETTQCPAP
ncbi:MAG: ATP-binding cassette domain-containing protein [Asticcacaulis sp.]|uniref:ABC transporter ATP-binding protein n=1 Tax=Asticcacaulis sp. TaxID=1872648 RepID=UPI0039E4BA6D